MHNKTMRTALLLAAAFALPAAAADEGINWLGDYQEARQLARKTGKPLFVEFRCEA